MINYLLTVAAHLEMQCFTLRQTDTSTPIIEYSILSDVWNALKMLNEERK